MRRLLLASALLCVTLPGLAPAAPADRNGITVTGAWSRAAMAGRTGIVYLTVTDTGAPDRLTGARSPVAAKATLHASIDDHGVMKMRSVAALPVRPGETLTLAPDGYHIMLEGLKQQLRPGETFPVTLIFAKAGAITATATVQKAGGGMAMDHGSTGGMNAPVGSSATGMPGMAMGGAARH
ncbi:MAG TPA: copper chaperone PCu(A)C [Acetobacteraceae bacterium]|nr:copper chaperone PCu(A)C [Acetobacteraceae bacterium]